MDTISNYEIRHYFFNTLGLRRQVLPSIRFSCIFALHSEHEVV